MGVSVSLIEGQTALAHVVGLNQLGHPQPFTAPPVWTVDQHALLALTPSSDGTSCTLAADGTSGSGTATVTVTDSADAGVAPATITVVVALGKITSLSVTVDPPTPAVAS